MTEAAAVPARRRASRSWCPAAGLCQWFKLYHRRWPRAAWARLSGRRRGQCPHWKRLGAGPGSAALRVRAAGLAAAARRRARLGPSGMIIGCQCQRPGPGHGHSEPIAIRKHGDRDRHGHERSRFKTGATVPACVTQPSVTDDGVTAQAHWQAETLLKHEAGSG